MPTKRHRFMVSLPPDWEQAIIARAKSQGRSVANYLENLAVRDIQDNIVELVEPAQPLPPIPLDEDENLSEIEGGGGQSKIAKPFPGVRDGVDTETKTPIKKRRSKARA